MQPQRSDTPTMTHPYSEATIVVLTDAYPYCGHPESVLVRPEIDALATRFRRVIVMPRRRMGDAYDSRRRPDVEICDDLTDATTPDGRLPLWLAILSGELPKWLVNGTDSRDTFSHAVQAAAFSRWITGWIKRDPSLSPHNTVFYTFRLNPFTSGLALASRRLHLRIVTRAHTDDLQQGNRQLRLFTARRCKAIFTTSDQTADVVRRRLSADPHVHIETRRLGCIDRHPATPAPHVMHSQLTFLTVGPISDDKRFDQMAEFIDALATAREKTIRWVIVGDGPRLSDLKKTLSVMPSNRWLHVELTGAVSNDDVHALYATGRIDWMLLLAEDSIGCPVAVCEALMHGVPVIANDVGGLSEMLDDDCGILLAANPRKEEFIRGIMPCIDSQLRYSRMRLGGREKWASDFDAALLREELADDIVRMTDVH